MNLITLFVAGFLSFLQSVHAQIPEVSWEKQMPVNSSNFFSDVLELPGGNFILLGAIEKPEGRSFDIWLLEFNTSGDNLKTKVFRNPGNDIPFRIVANGENGYIVSSVNKSNETVLKTRLMAVDSAFEEIWLTEAEQLSVVLQSDVAVDNSGQIWWLNTIAGVNEKPQIQLLKINSEGKKTAEFSFDENTPVIGYSIRSLQDGTLGIACQVQPQKGKPAIQVLRLDTEGKVLWKSIISQPDKILTPKCMCCSPDNTLLVGGWAGFCYNPDAPEEDQVWDFDYLLTRLDASGRILWTQNYNREGSEKGTAIAVLPDGNIMAAGRCETSFSGSIGPWLLFIDKNGEMVKDQVYKFRFMHDQAARIISTSDGGLLLVGPGYIETEQRFSGWIKKLNPVQ